MIKLGVIGMNEGNGHPYSFSAIFNGYDEQALKACPYVSIREYLPAHHRNEVMIKDAKVTHIWTQDSSLSESVARVSHIPHVVNHLEDMIGQVDAVILARDDPHNHWEMARPFIEKGIPIYIDKVLAHTIEDMKKIIAATGPDYPIMAGSSSRYTLNIAKAQEEIDVSKVKIIQGMSNVSWIRYASHLVDGICRLFGTDVQSVQNVGVDGADIVHIRYTKGPDVVLQVVAGLTPTIEFNCYSEIGQDPYKVAFVDREDKLRSYFQGFYNMLDTFIQMIKSGRQILSLHDITQVSKIIIAGEMSRNQGGEKIFLTDL